MLSSIKRRFEHAVAMAKDTDDKVIAILKSHNVYYMFCDDTWEINCNECSAYWSAPLGHLRLAAYFVKNHFNPVHNHGLYDDITTGVSA